jgi:pyruvate dehydrogenase E2 component (dihydrolipoamide acetyltransferase)
MSEIRMPSLGADMEEGTLLEWRIAVGDRVARGDIVGLVETQKATMEIESFADGVVEELLVAPGTKVPVGTVLARLRSEGEATTARRPAPPAPPSAPPGPPSASPAAPPAPAPAHAAPPPAAAPAHPAPPPPAPSPAPEERVRSSPAARQRARELGVDLRTVRGTGPHGAIVLRDVLAAAPPPPPTKPRRPAPPTGGPLREAIAGVMSRAKREIPHYYLAHTISMKRALGWLAEANAKRPIHERVLPGALLLRAVAVALWDFPDLNGFWTDTGYQPSEEVHLGTAIALRTGGLVAPAILDADEKSVETIMAELHDLVLRARANRLRASELTAPTITVSSLGERGCEVVYPIINPPQVAIVGFGTIADRPWVEGAAVVPHPTIVATLAADHRVSDGHRGALFLAALDQALQHPEKL